MLSLFVRSLLLVSIANGFRFIPPSSFHGIGKLQQNSVRLFAVHKVTIQHKGKDHILEVKDTTTILEAALDAGIDLPHDCDLGVCLTCPSKLVSGKIDQSSGSLDISVQEKGFALTCCSYPVSDCVIRSIDEDELVSAQFEGRESGAKVVD